MDNEELLEENFSESEYESEDDGDEFKMNTGKTIQMLGKVVQAIGIICTIIISIYLWFLASEAYYDEMEVIFSIAGFVCLIVGIIFSIIFGIFIVGFGELVENSEISRDYLYTIRSDIKELKNKK
ncbi:MAG: hypothetical protein U0M12_09155 [Acutalibacteraceae bacterium]|nr:hypothetical protein [Acutalibacteraceae bacterium]